MITYHLVQLRHHRRRRVHRCCCCCRLLPRRRGLLWPRMDLFRRLPCRIVWKTVGRGLASKSYTHAVGAVLALKTFDNVKETTPALEDLLKAAAKQVFLGHLFPLLPNSICEELRCVTRTVRALYCAQTEREGALFRPVARPGETCWLCSHTIPGAVLARLVHALLGILSTHRT